MARTSTVDIPSTVQVKAAATSAKNAGPRRTNTLICKPKIDEVNDHNQLILFKLKHNADLISKQMDDIDRLQNRNERSIAQDSVEEEKPKASARGSSRRLNAGDGKKTGQ